MRCSLAGLQTSTIPLCGVRYQGFHTPFRARRTQSLLTKRPPSRSTYLTEPISNGPGKPNQAHNANVP